MQTRWDRALDAAAWVGYAVFAAYLLLKAAGVLHSPPIADIIGAAGVLVFLGRHLQKMDHLHLDVNGLKTQVKGLETGMAEVKTDIKHMDARLGRVETRLDGVEMRLGRVEASI